VAASALAEVRALRAEVAEVRAQNERLAAAVKKQQAVLDRLVARSELPGAIQDAKLDGRAAMSERECVVAAAQAARGQVARGAAELAYLLETVGAPPAAGGAEEAAGGRLTAAAAKQREALIAGAAGFSCYSAADGGPGGAASVDLHYNHTTGRWGLALSLGRKYSQCQFSAGVDPATPLADWEALFARTPRVSIVFGGGQAELLVSEEPHRSLWIILTGKGGAPELAYRERRPARLLAQLRESFEAARAQGFPGRPRPVARVRQN
jgi:hypothetical protein